MTAGLIAATCWILIGFGLIWRITQAIQWILNGRRS